MFQKKKKKREIEERERATNLLPDQFQPAFRIALQPPCSPLFEANKKQSTSMIFVFSLEKQRATDFFYVFAEQERSCTCCKSGGHARVRVQSQCVAPAGCESAFVRGSVRLHCALCHQGQSARGSAASLLSRHGSRSGRLLGKRGSARSQVRSARRPHCAQLAAAAQQSVPVGARTRSVFHCHFSAPARGIRPTAAWNCVRSAPQSGKRQWSIQQSEIKEKEMIVCFFFFFFFFFFKGHDWWSQCWLWDLVRVYSGRFEDCKQVSVDNQQGAHSHRSWN